MTDDPYDYDDQECANCGGEGFVYGCSWDWQCDTYDAGEGTCLCTRPCDWCHPRKPTKETEVLRKVLAAALAGNPHRACLETRGGTDGHTGGISQAERKN